MDEHLDTFVTWPTKTQAMCCEDFARLTNRSVDSRSTESAPPPVPHSAVAPRRIVWTLFN
jgi:hypothetical protein